MAAMIDEHALYPQPARDLCPTLRDWDLDLSDNWKCVSNLSNPWLLPTAERQLRDITLCDL